MTHIFMGKNVHIIPTKQLLFVVAREVKTQTIEIWFGNVKNASKYAALMLKRGVYLKLTMCSFFLFHLLIFKQRVG